MGNKKHDTTFPEHGKDGWMEIPDEEILSAFLELQSMQPSKSASDISLSPLLAVVINAKLLAKQISVWFPIAGTSWTNAVNQDVVNHVLNASIGLEHALRAVLPPRNRMSQVIADAIAEVETSHSIILEHYQWTARVKGNATSWPWRWPDVPPIEPMLLMKLDNDVRCLRVLLEDVGIKAPAQWLSLCELIALPAPTPLVNHVRKPANTLRPINKTEKRILQLCNRRSLKGAVIARELELEYGYIRHVLGKMVKDKLLKKNDNGYRSL